ncbi:MAG: cupredoxin domain-containing protein [Nitrospiraceae bacterium]
MLRRGVLWVLFAVGLLCGGEGRAFAQAGGDGSATAAVAAVIGADGIQRATLVLDSYSYTPSHLVVQVNQPVELTLTSVTTLVPHNFVVKDGGLTLEQDVSPGKSVVLRFTPTQVGTFPFYCDKQLLFFKSHREKGMEGLLDVRP